MSSLHNNEASSSHTTPRIYIARKAQELLATRDITGITQLVSNICYGKETEESPSSTLLYESFKEHFPNILALKLLQVYRFATDKPPKIRSFALTLLESVLIQLDTPDGLQETCMNKIKTLLNFCLLEQVTSDEDFKLISRIVSRVALDVFLRGNQWEELCSYIVSLDGNKKALLLFSELPMALDDEFLKPLLENDLGLKIANVLLNRDLDHDDEAWCLALEAGFSLMLHLVLVKRKSWVPDSVYVIVNAIWEMVNVKGREIVVRKSFVRIARKIGREALRFREGEYGVVSRLGWMIHGTNGVGDVTKKIVELIPHVLERYYMGGGQDIDYKLLSTIL